MFYNLGLMTCHPATLPCLLQGEPDGAKALSARRSRNPMYVAALFQRATDPVPAAGNPMNIRPDGASRSGRATDADRDH